MDADLKYMREAIKCYDTYGFKVCRETFTKVNHRTTISRYRKCVQEGHRSNSKVSYERTRERLVRRILAEEQSNPDAKIGIKRVRELFHEVKADQGMSLSNKVCNDALKRARMCSKMCRVLGNEEMNDEGSNFTAVGPNGMSRDWINFEIQWPKLLLLGDSLTQFAFSNEGCWASILAARYVRTVDIVNRGLSGYNSKWYLRVLPKLLQNVDCSTVACVTIFLGANDAALIECPSNQHVPVAEFYDNLVEIINELTRRGCDKSRLIVMSPPPYDHKAFMEHRRLQGETTEMARSPQAVNFYVRACKRLSEKMGLTYCDINRLLKADKKPFTDGRSSEVLIDGLHFSAKGATMVAEYLEPFISQKIREFNRWDSLRQNCPNWRDVAQRDLEMEIEKIKSK